MIIDAHQHFWKLARGDYGWLTPELEPLYRDFMPDDLAPILRETGVDGTVLVQAAPTLAETQFLLEIADATPFVLGVVGWVDFESKTAPDDIARLARHPKLVGLRPMIQDIHDDAWMLREDLTRAFHAMITADLTFDALVMPQHLSNLRKLLARHPQLRTVIDHGAKPDIANANFAAWASDIAAIAKINGVSCKLSGLLPQAGGSWTKTDLAPYVAHLFECFGSERLLWGSDWPVLTVTASYEMWLKIASDFIPIGEGAAEIFGSNAVTFYRLSKS